MIIENMSLCFLCRKCTGVIQIS